jgi:uncharacterized protein (DUF1684 family)
MMRGHTQAMTPQDYLDLAHWRRRVGDLYRLGGPLALAEFRRGRDELLRTHPQSPIAPEERASFSGLSYFDPDPSCRIDCRLEPPAEAGELVIETGGEDGAIRYRRAGSLRFRLHGEECRLTVFWLLGYGGGLFLPFRDATAPAETYGAGRYLFDTIKNTDGLALAITPGSLDVTIDFNFAYNPSCAYNPRWACPLAPPENRLAVPIRAGEKRYV